MNIYRRYKWVLLLTIPVTIVIILILNINKKPSGLEAITSLGNLSTDFFQVDGSSMEPTFHDGDIVHYYTRFDENSITKGMIVVFKDSKDLSSLMIKRVVSTSGEVSVKDNVLYENGNVSPYVTNTKYSSYFIHDSTWKVGDDEVFVVGDNYNNSIDSRSYGSIKASSIIGIVKE